jgi:hypothetical protein
MTFIFLLLGVFSFISNAQQFYVINVSDSAIDKIFQGIANSKFNNHSSADNVNVAKAVNTLVMRLTPDIFKYLGGTKPFTINCSVFFNNKIEGGSCDIAAALSQGFIPDMDSSCDGIPLQYAGQIVNSNILFAQGFIDLTGNPRKYNYKTQVFFCEESPTKTITIEPPPSLSSKSKTTTQIKTHDNTDTKSTSASNSYSKSDTHTRSISTSDSYSPLEPVTKKQENTDTASTSTSHTYSNSDTYTHSSSISHSSSPSETLTKKQDNTDTISTSMSHPYSKSDTHTHSSSISHSSSPSETLTKRQDNTDTISTSKSRSYSNSDTDVPSATITYSHSEKDTATPEILKTPSMSNTYSATTSLNRSRSLTNSDVSTITNSESLDTSVTETFSKTITISNTVTISNQNSQTDSDTVTPSVSVSSTETSQVLPWQARTGVYADSTNQTNRFHVINGTVVDNLTKLQWEQENSTSTMNWTYANNSYCQGRTTGGYTDWRLPSISEYQSIVDYTLDYNGPTIDTTVFIGTPAVEFWTSVPKANDSSRAWFIAYGTSGDSGVFGGEVYYTIITLNYSVRCVRGDGQPILVNRYNANNFTVTDNLTGLEWERHVTYRDVWSNASSHCENQTIGGKTNWRLPTIKELSTLVDYSVASGVLCMNSVFVGDNASYYYYWSSTVVSGYSSYAQTVGFSNGMVSDGDENYPRYARCVHD